MNAKSIKILFVDDEWKDSGWDVLLNAELGSRGILVEYEDKGMNALSRLEQNPSIQLLLLDLYFKEQPKHGKDILREIKEVYPEMPVIILTADDRLQSAVECVKLGAYNYFVKQELDIEKWAIEIKNAVALAETHREIRYLRAELEEKTQFDTIVGESPAIQAVFECIRNVAQTPDTTVLITGETGAGKGLVAEAIHHHNTSSRKRKPFVKINISAVPSELMESELFGHEKGAFTGATSRRTGRFELADEGTIFLDEIGDIPLTLQPKLLRVLQEHEFERVGGSRTMRVDVRVIAATNHNLDESIHKGRFREDLYYRLKVVEIQVPPLRERKEDIPLLVSHFLNKFNQKLNRNVEAVDEKVMLLLMKYDWPGNIRELENYIESAFVLSTLERATILECTHFPPHLKHPVSKPLSSVESNLIKQFFDQIYQEEITLNDIPFEYQLEVVKKVLEQEEGQGPKAAAVLKVTESALRRKLSAWKISTLDYRKKR